MRIILQRVERSAVAADGESLASIGQGYLLLTGIMKGDTEAQAAWLAQKIVHLRLFDGENGKINDRSILDVGGEILVVSQFTLAADIAKGNRPDYTAAAAPAEAEALYERFTELLQEQGVRKVETGRFGAHMSVDIVNDGPVTLILERSAGAT